jgi:hypothetical protein
VANHAFRQRLVQLEERLRFSEAAYVPDGERVGAERIRNREELGWCIKFMLEVYKEGMTESVWAAAHPKEYERIAKIAGTVPARKAGEES